MLTKGIEITLDLRSTSSTFSKALLSEKAVVFLNAITNKIGELSINEVLDTFFLCLSVIAACILSQALKVFEDIHLQFMLLLCQVVSHRNHSESSHLAQTAIPISLKTFSISYPISFYLVFSDT